MNPQNLFNDSTIPATGERFDALLAHRNLRVERIISSASPEQTEHRQTQDEWVVLLRGDASLEVAGQTIELRAGDHLFLPSGTPHRVRRTSEGAMWLAVHLDEKTASTAT